MEHAVAVRRRYGDMIDPEILGLIVMYLIRGMISVESVMILFSVCKCINAQKKERLSSIVKKLMPEVPRERWGLMEDRTGREFLVLYRNFKHGDVNDVGSFVPPGRHLHGQSVFFQSHTSTLLMFSNNPHAVSAERTVIDNRIRFTFKLIFDNFTFQVDYGNPIDLSLARGWGVFASKSSRDSFASFLREKKLEYENKHHADIINQEVHGLCILLMDCLLELLEKSYGIGLVDQFDYGDLLIRYRSESVHGIQVDVVAEDVTAINARLPYSHQIFMQNPGNVQEMMNAPTPR
jgi:hypothetical protein